MKSYDFAKAKKFIEDNISSINRASLGMDEDWFWTAETIFENGSFTKNLKGKIKGFCFRKGDLI